MGPNMLMIPIAAIIPVLVAAFWYNPSIFGTLWIREAGVTNEKMQKFNWKITAVFIYIFSCFVGVILMGISIHQMGIYQLFSTQEGFGTAGTVPTEQFETVIKIVGNKHLSFGHGALHGVLTGVFFVLPILAISALLEMKSWKYIWINVGYWILSLGLMGGVFCQWGWTAA